jgi:hypothetical protein
MPPFKLGLLFFLIPSGALGVFFNTWKEKQANTRYHYQSNLAIGPSKKEAFYDLYERYIHAKRIDPLSIGSFFDENEPKIFVQFLFVKQEGNEERYNLIIQLVVGNHVHAEHTLGLTKLTMDFFTVLKNRPDSTSLHKIIFYLLFLSTIFENAEEEEMVYLDYLVEAYLTKILICAGDTLIFREEGLQGFNALLYRKISINFGNFILKMYHSNSHFDSYDLAVAFKEILVLLKRRHYLLSRSTTHSLYTPYLLSFFNTLIKTLSRLYHYTFGEREHYPVVNLRLLMAAEPIIPPSRSPRRTTSRASRLFLPSFKRIEKP